MNFEHQTVLITGGSAGIGWELALQFASHHAQHVYVGDLVSPDSHLPLSPPYQVIEYIHLDVTQENDWKQVIAQIQHLDILINNAGIAGSGYTFAGCSTAEFRRVIEVIAQGSFLGIKTCWPLLTQSHGNIVNILSIAALRGTFMGPAYHAAKGAVRLLTKKAAILDPKVRVNAVCPTVCHLMQGMKGNQLLLEFATDSPNRRWCTPHDVCPAVLFLADNRLSGYINGIDLPIDGGKTSSVFYHKL